MISISEKSTVKESNDYHIKIVGATALMRTEARCRDVINSFLDVLFTLDFLATEIEDEPEDAPLEFSRHSFEAAAPTSILLVSHLPPSNHCIPTNRNVGRIEAKERHQSNLRRSFRTVLQTHV